MRYMSKFTLLPLLIMITFVQCSKQPSCSDGIQNGNELFPDCGGDCGPCYSFNGIYEVVTFSINSTNFFTTFQKEKLYYDFQGNQIKTVLADNKGALTIEITNYTLGTDQNTITFNNSKLNINPLSTDEYQLSGTDQNNNQIVQTIRKVVGDLCAGVNCNTGSCQYGYCICNSGFSGRNCSVPAGSAGEDIAVVIYDKGQFTNGWRYIEVTHQYFINKPWGCQNVAGLTNGIGSGKTNTELIFSKCGNNAVAAKFALDFAISGFSDWYLPSIDELTLVCQSKQKVGDYPQHPIGIWSSSDNGLGGLAGVNRPMDLNAETCARNQADQTIGYAVFLIRYF